MKVFGFSKLTRGNRSLLKNGFNNSKTFHVHRILKNPVKYKCHYWGTSESKTDHVQFR